MLSVDSHIFSLCAVFESFFFVFFVLFCFVFPSFVLLLMENMQSLKFHWITMLLVASCLTSSKDGRPFFSLYLTV